MKKLFIKSIKEYGIRKVYDLSVSVNHNFFIGKKEILTHNCDGLTVATQPALRHFMEKYSSNAGFILTCNYPNKLIKELHSRDATIEFKIPKVECSKIAASFFKRILEILEKESVTYDKAVVAEIINKYFPDFRKTLNELQKYSASGIIDTGILSSLHGIDIHDLIKFIKQKNYTECRKWIAENFDGNSADLFRKFYDTSMGYLSPSSIPALILLIGKYSFQSSLVADQEVNACAFIAELLIEGIYNE